MKARKKSAPEKKSYYTRPVSLKVGVINCGAGAAQAVQAVYLWITIETGEVFAIDIAPVTNLT